MPSQHDVSVLRSLAANVREIAELPIQEEKRRLWRRLNALQPERPMVMIDQVCWNELNTEEPLVLKCEDPECRTYEQRLRRTLYQWEHFPADMVVEPYISVSKAVYNTGFGVQVEEEVIATSSVDGILAHRFHNQFETEADLEKLQTPKISHDENETARQLAFAQEVFEDILPVKLDGVEPYLSIWDPISTWMGVENALFALIERPEYMHRLVTKMTEGYLSMLNQMEELGVLCAPQTIIHCTGAYTDELPAPDYNPLKPRTKDIWMFGLAQMFSTVSPETFYEFEVQYTSRICERFGLVYYGCCDPLDGKMNEVRQIPHVRKVSMSPWVNQERGAEEIGHQFVFSRKPNPAFLAEATFDPELIRRDLIMTKDICARNNCPLEFILKDISTVRYEPARLDRWNKIAMEIVSS